MIGGIFVVVIYCFLCNFLIVFDCWFDGEVLDFGMMGFLCKLDLVMYDW